jgi:hypothetical protein
MYRAVACLLLLAGCLPATKSVATPAAKTTGKPAATSTDPKDPYPECAHVRKWLSKNLAVPDSLEIVEWKRNAYGPLDAKGKHRQSTIIFTYRFTNQFGGRSIDTKAMSFTDGKPGGSIDSEGKASYPPE